VYFKVLFLQFYCNFFFWRAQIFGFALSANLPCYGPEKQPIDTISVHLTQSDNIKQNLLYFWVYQVIWTRLSFVWSRCTKILHGNKAELINAIFCIAFSIQSNYLGNWTLNDSKLIIWKILIAYVNDDYKKSNNIVRVLGIQLTVWVFIQIHLKWLLIGTKKVAVVDRWSLLKLIPQNGCRRLEGVICSIVGS
jgi:hypothetical protein